MLNYRRQQTETMGGGGVGGAGRGAVKVSDRVSLHGAVKGALI